jgi:hypothetical protein
VPLLKRLLSPVSKTGDNRLSADESGSADEDSERASRRI